MMERTLVAVMIEMTLGAMMMDVTLREMMMERSFEALKVGNKRNDEESILE